MLEFVTNTSGVPQTSCCLIQKKHLSGPPFKRVYRRLLLAKDSIECLVLNGVLNREERKPTMHVTTASAEWLHITLFP